MGGPLGTKTLEPVENRLNECGQTLPCHSRDWNHFPIDVGAEFLEAVAREFIEKNALSVGNLDI